MLKKIFCGSMLALCSSLALADIPDPGKWHFQWTGFYDQQDGQFHDSTLSGYFGGVDANHNNEIELSELTQLVIHGIDFTKCTNSPPSSCGVNAFSFKLGGDLNFDAGYTNVWSDNRYSNGERYVAGDRITWTNTSPSGSSEKNWFFTAQTSYLLSPVPEPQTWAMLAAGLLLLTFTWKGKNRA